MKRLASLFLLLMVATLCGTTAADTRLAKINTIKKSADYIYADVTMPTQADATSQAYEQLQREVLSWAAARFLDDELSRVSVIDINRMADTITTPRANMFRVFAFVSKDILSRHFRPDTATAAPTSRLCDIVRQNYLGGKGGIIEKIKSARDFFNLRQIMEPLHESGDITAYGKYATAEHPEDCYLIIYDPAGNIRALLSPGTDFRWNLKTNATDALDNYRGCGAIWFKLKE